MAKLVGVYHDEVDPNRTKPTCLARRQLPLDIEQDLTMIMALDDACLACSSSTLITQSNDSNNKKNSKSPTDAHHCRERESFLKKYESMSSDEISAALMVTFDDLMTTLSNEVTCVGCRRSVETLVHRLYKTGDSALEPLVITEDGVISVSRDHILTPQALANLFCVQLQRLQLTYVDTSHGAKNKKKSVRCSAHSLGLGLKRMMAVGNWLETWECMEKECQEEVVLIHFDLLRSTLDRYLKKHSFCTECTNMVNRAFNILIKPDDDRAATPEVVTSSCQAGSVCSDQDDSCKSDNLYRGITACTADQHVHVEGSTDFVSKLINLAEPELNGLRQERHAKTIEIAQKEVLTCIGICLYERFQRIQQKLREGQQSCDILFLVALKSLKKSYDMYFESKQGISDLERLCQEFDEEDRRKLEKAQKKRDKKSKQQLKKKKDQDKVEPGNDQTDGIARTGVCVKVEPCLKNQPENEAKSRSRSSSSSGSSGSTSSLNKICSVNKNCDAAGDGEKNDDESNHCDENVNSFNKSVVESRVSSSVSHDRKNDAKVSSDVPPQQTSASRLSCVTSVCRKTTKIPPPESFSILSLERMLDGSDGQDELDDSHEEGIPIEEIRNFQARQSDVSQQRAELRKNLRQRFAQLCVNGL